VTTARPRGYRGHVSFPRRRNDQHVPAPPTPGHEVHIEDGRFATAVCSCGWQGAGRRNRATARTEARDHALLYADGSLLSAELGGPPPEVPALPDRADA
jgi:hypothetical protein